MGRASRRKRRLYFHTADARVVRTCPVCGDVHEAATSVGATPDVTHQGPEPGQITVCARCGTVCVATATGERLATQADLDALPVEQRQLIQTLTCALPLGRRGQA